MNLRRTGPDGKLVDHQIDLTRPTSIIFSMLTGAVVGAAAGLSGMSQVVGKGGAGRGRIASAKGLAVFGGVTSALNTVVSGAAGDVAKKANDRFQPKGGVSNFVEEPYKKMWEERRRRYGNSGRRK